MSCRHPDLADVQAVRASYRRATTLVPGDSAPCAWVQEDHGLVCETRRGLYDAVREAQRLPDDTPRKADRIVACVARHAAHSCELDPFTETCLLIDQVIQLAPRGRAPDIAAELKAARGKLVASVVKYGDARAGVTHG